MSEYLGWQLSPRIVAFTAFSLGVAIGVVYEVYEFFGKVFFLTIDQGGYDNTASDLVSDVLGAGLGVLFIHFYDPMNKTSDRSGQLPIPSEVRLTNVGTIPLMIMGVILSLDYLLLNGSIVGSDYDLIGLLMLSTLFVSGLLVAYFRFQNPKVNKTDSSEKVGMSS